MYERYMSMGQEVKEINWKQARGALYRWPQVMRKSLGPAKFLSDCTDTTTQLCLSTCANKLPAQP
jgi:hypothetical protein